MNSPKSTPSQGSSVCHCTNVLYSRVIFGSSVHFEFTETECPRMIVSHFFKEVYRQAIKLKKSSTRLRELDFTFRGSFEVGSRHELDLSIFKFCAPIVS